MHCQFSGQCHIWWQVDSTTRPGGCTIKHHGPVMYNKWTNFGKLVSFSLLVPSTLALTNTLACNKVNTLWIRNAFKLQAPGAMLRSFSWLASLAKGFLIRILLFAWMKQYWWKKEEKKWRIRLSVKSGVPKFFVSLYCRTNLAKQKKLGGWQLYFFIKVHLNIMFVFLV